MQQSRAARYIGTIGGVYCRLVFIFVGEYLMHGFYFMDLVFGSVLLYTGVETITADEEDEDPSQHPLVLWVQVHMSFVNDYGSRGCFLVGVPVADHGKTNLPKPGVESAAQLGETSARLAESPGSEDERVLVAGFCG